ncbi:MAG TPA: ATPase, partial [Thermoanaerobaculia bacterium]|nr:ATPase [Thermoanaerobaculia bacterium]
MGKRFASGFAAAVAILAAAGAPAEVVDVADNGFTVRNSVVVPVDASKAYLAVVDGVGRWWDPEHTFSRDAANLSIEAKPRGCFCEKLPDQGFVEHMRVIHAMPGK